MSPLNSDKGACEDIDECMDVDFVCDPNAMCVNDIMDVAKVSFNPAFLFDDSPVFNLFYFSTWLEQWKLIHVYAVQEKFLSSSLKSLF